MNTCVVHILREANRCVNVLVKIGLEQNEAIVKLMVPSNKIVKKHICCLKGYCLYCGYLLSYCVCSFDQKLSPKLCWFARFDSDLVVALLNSKLF